MPYRYKKKIQQCEIHLAHKGPLSTSQVPPPSLEEQVRSLVECAQGNSSKLLAEVSMETGRTMSAGQNAIKAASFAAISTLQNHFPDLQSPP